MLVFTTNWWRHII